MSYLTMLADFAAAYPNLSLAYGVFQLLAFVWAAAALYSWEKNPNVPPALVLEYFPGWDLGGYAVRFEHRPAWAKDYWRTALLVLTPGINLLTVGLMMPIYAFVQVSQSIKDWRFKRDMREMTKIWG